MLNDARGSQMPTTTADRRPSLVSIVALDTPDDSALLALAASLAGSLNTPFAAAIVESAQERQIEPRQVEQFHRTTAMGVAAAVDGHSVALGNAGLLTQLGVSIASLGDWPERLRRRGEQVLFVSIDGRAAGLLGVADAPCHRQTHADRRKDEMGDAVLSAEQFPTQMRDLPASRQVESIELADGDEFQLRIAPVTKRLGDATVRMLAYNGSIPGPTLRVQQGSEVLVTVVNEGDLEATVHWHGLRLDNRYDGTLATQPPIPFGARFTYRLTFPDPGIYWYHPHIREDYGQEMGLYGNIVVVPSQPDYWPRAHRELALTLDDILVEGARLHHSTGCIRRSPRWAVSATRCW
jgi:FtsP/CotA-like multicopper oxidase with cupredoxin domain